MENGVEKMIIDTDYENKMDKFLKAER